MIFLEAVKFLMFMALVVLLELFERSMLSLASISRTF